MKVRIISGVVAALLAITILYFTPLWSVTVVVSLLCAIACFELLWSTGLVTHRRMVFVACVSAGSLPWWSFAGSSAIALQTLIVLLLCYCFIECVFSGATVPFNQIAITLFGALLLPYALSSLLRIYQLPNGKILILVPLIAAWVSDSFALFGGMLFGKHKLAPLVSPKKTVEGAISGALGAALGMLVFAWVTNTYFSFELGYLSALLIGLVGSVLGQIGDLSFSSIKRQCKIKDYGEIMPGHGGVLDRFDSVIFTGLAVELLWKYLG